MKIARIAGPAGRPVPCIIDDQGRPRDISNVTVDVTPEALADGLLDRLHGLDPETRPVVDGHRLAPITRPPTIWCVGLNYADHAAESGLPIPTEPILFNKPVSAFSGPDDDILYGPGMSKLDWEVELGIIISRPGLHVTPDNAMAHVAGFVVVNDVSERAWQTERGGQWVKGKAYPSFCPTGPWLVTPDEIADVGALDLWLDVNGQRRQNGSTARMIFDLPAIIAYISGFALLSPGDLICTGTPPGVGAGMKPPRWLAVGDLVELGIEGLGSQKSRVVAHEGSGA